MARKSIFLSGWEYNRILQKNPVKSRQSALPSEALWNGVAQFWLFESVFCTKDSIDGEIAAAETLGWATGLIFQDLKKRGFLKVYDWNNLKKESPFQYQRLVDAHQALRHQYDEEALLNLLQSGEDTKLEEIKLDLLKPIIDHLQCITNISPNSIRQWISSKQQDKVSSSTQALQKLVKPLEKQSFRAGTRLCQPPGTGVSHADRAAQQFIEATVQKPMVPDLLAGRLSQTDYHNILLPSANVYQPINNQLWQDYQANISKLERLRDIASRHLWKELHEEWLPELEQDPASRVKFEGRLRDALARTAFDPFLNIFTTIAIVVTAGAVGHIVSTLAPTLGISPEIVGTVGFGAAEKVLDDQHKKLRQQSDQLTMFYQKAQKVLRE